MGHHDLKFDLSLIFITLNFHYPYIHNEIRYRVLSDFLYLSLRLVKQECKMEREGKNLLKGFMNFLLTLDFGYSLQPKKQMFSWQYEKTASSAKIDNKAVQGAKTHARLQRADSEKRPSHPLTPPPLKKIHSGKKSLLPVLR